MRNCHPCKAVAGHVNQGIHKMKTLQIATVIALALGSLTTLPSAAQAGNKTAIIEIPVNVSAALGNQIKVQCDVVQKDWFGSPGIVTGGGQATRSLDGTGTFNGVVHVNVRYTHGDSYVCTLLVKDHRNRWVDARQAAPGSDTPAAARAGSDHRAEHFDWARM
jgi:hypothetical protein